VQDSKDLNLFAGAGVALREVVMKPGHGRADPLLYVDRCAVGVIEAKPRGTTRWSWAGSRAWRPYVVAPHPSSSLG
jgi:hypothetical protein